MMELQTVHDRITVFHQKKSHKLLRLNENGNSGFGYSIMVLNETKSQKSKKSCLISLS